MTDPAMFDQIGDAILGPRRYDRIETAARAGVPLDMAVALWRAMGFAVVGDDQRLFGDRDVEALRTAYALVADGVSDEAGLLALTRAMAQSLSRLAVSHAAIATPWLASIGDDARAVQAAADELVPRVASLLEFVWRRHLAVAAEGVVAGLGAEGDEVTRAVGFADLVGFTELTRSLSADELAALVESFESAASEVVGAHGGRVVKTLGDEVMFEVGDPGAAAEIALALLDAVDRDIRVGLGYGPVLARLGDVYGPVVNIAARLTGLALPGTVLVDREAARALGDRYDVAPLRRQAVRGYAHLAPFRLRRAR